MWCKGLSLEGEIGRNQEFLTFPSQLLTFQAILLICLWIQIDQLGLHRSDVEKNRVNEQLVQLQMNRLSRSCEDIHQILTMITPQLCYCISLGKGRKTHLKTRSTEMKYPIDLADSTFLLPQCFKEFQIYRFPTYEMLPILSKVSR